jgi:hypothetical protein
MSETVTVSRADLELLQKVCACYAPYPVTDDIREVMERTLAALREPAGGEEAPAGDSRPDGIWGRVELPGRRDHTGWIASASVFGAEGLVVRDWDGRIIADVVMGPACQVVRLPTPLKRPEPRPALPAGGWGWDGAGEDEAGEGLDDEPAF